MNVRQVTRVVLLLATATVFIPRTSPAATQVETVADTSGLHAAMVRAIREEGLVGASWALLDAGATMTGAAGLRDARRGEPLSSATRMQVGSVAKTLIATGVLRLVTEGRLSLDAPPTARL